MTTLALGAAINAGLRSAMDADPNVMVMGEDVGTLGGVLRVTAGLKDAFGPSRVVDTPLAESGFVGTAIGLSPSAGTIESIHVREGETVDVGTILVTIADGAAVSPVTELEEERPLVLVGTGPSAPAERRRHVRRNTLSANQPTTGNADASLCAAARVPTDDAAGPQRGTRVPIKGVRKATAAAMVASAFTAPHVTVWLAVDVSRTVELLGRLKQDRGWAGIR